MEQLDPTAVRMQRSAFLASLGRPISPPSSVSTSEGKQFSTPAVIDLDNDAETESPRKKQRLHPRSMSRPPTTSPVPTVAKSRYLPSPFRLTRIKDLPDIDNVDAVSLHDILGNPLIREAWIFNYCFDVDWTMQHFDAGIRNSVSVKIIHGSWRNEDQNKRDIDDACRRWENVQAIQAYLPDAFGTHHTKMIVLFRHDGVAEIIIHTANMQAGDWRYATQAAWRSPELKEGPSTISISLADADPNIGSGALFKLDFLRYLKAYGKKLGDLVQQIFKYDFSPIRGALIASVPSKLKNVYGPDARTACWGHPAMFHALKEVRRRRQTILPITALPQHSHIVCQCSSIATLKAGWLQDTLLSAMNADSPMASAATCSIIYPTAADVGGSLGGYGCGSSIHMKIQSASHQKQVATLQPYLCRWTRGKGDHARRDEVAPHIKTYVSFKSEPTTTNASPAINWALLTSANLSTQAWGTEAKMPTEKGRKKSKFNAAEAEVHIQSFELGVLVWPELWADEVGDGTAQPCAMVPVFGKDLPNSAHPDNSSIVIGLRMPYDLPLTPYTLNDVPWSPNVPHSQPDRYGRTWPVNESWFT